jgi:hypothetical protein
MSENNAGFKQCPSCEFTWASRDDLLADPLLKIRGYQVDFEDLVSGLFFKD